MLEALYDGTPKVINLSTEIGRLLGIVDASFLRKPKTELRKKNRVKTIRASLAIEGNTLTEEQITAILENKRVKGPTKDILEVKNAIEVYNAIDSFDPFDEQSYLRAHGILMNGLIENPGIYRAQNVGVVQGGQVAHLAPPGWNVQHLMRQLFNYLKTSEDNLIIKSCVFHYEMEFIHPFYDGNGRMGRLWQTVILMQVNPIFEFLPIEHVIKENQDQYYQVLSESDKSGKSTKFIEFSLQTIKVSLEEIVRNRIDPKGAKDRLVYFMAQFKESQFTRKAYLNFYKKISPATASRDLKKGTDLGLLIRKGDKNSATYQVNME